MSEPPDTDTETFEHIPWSHLMEARLEGRNRTAVVVGGIVLAVVAGFAASRMFGGSDPPRTVVTAVATPTTADGTTATTAITAPASTVPVTLSPLSEADLMAAVPGDTGGVAAVAEWFVTDYFSFEAADGSGSFVQWARAFDLQDAGTEYVVTVVFSALGAAADGIYRRLPIRAVAVSLAEDTDGWSPAGLPRPVAVPNPPPRVGVPAATEPVPESVAAAAAASLDGWPTVEVIGGQPGAGGWTVIVEAGDEAGNAWLLQVELPG